jgi:hypothetical protein
MRGRNGTAGTLSNPYYNDKTGLITPSTLAINPTDRLIDHRTGDKTTLYIDLTKLHANSGSVASGGGIEIRGLQLTRTGTVSETRQGDVRVTIRCQGASDTLTVGVFANRSVDMTVEDREVPTIASGAFPENRDDESIRVLDVTVKEVSRGSWNNSTDVEAIFSLPEGVKFRAVDVRESKGLTSNYGTGLSVSDLTDTNHEEKWGTITAGVEAFKLTADKFTIVGNNSGRSGGGDDTIEVRFRAFVSVRPGFTGDIKIMTHDDNEAFGTGHEVVVARAVDPVTVSTTTTDIQIGLLDIPLAEIVIKEHRQ